MTEKKTFKNPKFVSGMSMKTPQYWEVHNEIYGEPAGTFTRDEWDMEVTFTKKVKPLEIGQTVEVYPLNREYPFQGEVLWFDDKHALISQWGAPEVVNREHIGL